MPIPAPSDKSGIPGGSLIRWGSWFFLGVLIWVRAVDGGHSPWEMNEALELLKVRVLMADAQWYRTMWDDQPATLMWMLHGWFSMTGASVEAARALVIGLMTVALSAVAARAEGLLGRWAGLALAPLLLVNPELTQLMGSCMLEPASIALALMGGLLFWSRVERPTGWAMVGAGALTGWALAVKLTAALPAQLAFWGFLHALWRAWRGDRALLARRIVGNALVFGGVAIGGAGLLLAAGGHDWSTVHDSHVRGVFGDGGWADLRSRTNTRALTDVWWDAYASLALVPTSLLLAWRHPRIWRWVFPWAMTLVISTAVLWVYPFWHNYYLIHVALPMAALVAPTVAVTARALWGLLRMWARQRGGEARTGRTGQQHVAWGSGAAFVAGGLAVVGLVLTENLSVVRRTVNPERDRDAQAMLEMLEQHGSRAATVFASHPNLTLFRAGALPVKGLELVVEKRRLCGDLSPASALAILQKDPPAMVLTHDQNHAPPTINSPFAGTNFLERHYVKALENSAGQLWVRRE